MNLGLLLGLFCTLGIGGLLGWCGGFGSNFREDMKEYDEPDEDETDYENGFGLDGQAGAVLWEVLEWAAFFGHSNEVILFN